MLRPVSAFLMTLVVGTATAACSRSEPSRVTVGRSPSPPPTVVETPGTPVSFIVSSFDVEGAGDPASVERVKAAVVATFTRYLQDGVLAPLRTGGPAGDLLPLFTARAAAHLGATADRNAFVDEGLPPSTRITDLAPGLRLTALADQAGDVVLVAARMDLRLVAGAQGTTITIDRDADLVLVADGDAWKIDAYRMRVTRDTPDSSTTVIVDR